MANVLGGIEDRGAPGAVYSILLPIPVVCFLGALITDIVYVSGAFLMWLHFSQWLIAAGVALGVVAGIALLVELVGMRGAPMGWAHVVLFFAGLVVEIFNAFVHTADGWTAVMPAGLSLSAIGAVLMLAAAVTLARGRARTIEYRRL